MTIKGQDYKLKYTLRALFIYEQITGKAFELKTITDEYLFFYCVLMANNPDSSLTFEELIEAIDEYGYYGRVPELFKEGTGEAAAIHY